MPEKSIATTAEARAWLVAHPKTFGRLSENAKRTVAREGLRGRLHPEAIAAFNKGQHKAQYVLGSTKETRLAAVKEAATVRKAVARKAARKGVVIGKRGPLPKSFR